MLKQVTKVLASRLKPQLTTSSARCESSIADPPQASKGSEKSINQVSLLGRVGGEPQKRGTDRHPVVIFSMATNSRYEPPDGEAVSHTEWHRISVFKPALRDTVYTYLRKGQRVYVTGRLNYGEVRDESGNPRQVTSIIAEDIIFFQSYD